MIDIQLQQSFNRIRTRLGAPNRKHPLDTATNIAVEALAEVASFQACLARIQVVVVGIHFKEMSHRRGRTRKKLTLD
jgi:hypothetical protein